MSDAHNRSSEHRRAIMTDEYTPTTRDVRATYRRGESVLAGRDGSRPDQPRQPYESPAELYAEFDRWLLAHDRDVEATVLLDAAEAMDEDEPRYPSMWLRRRTEVPRCDVPPLGWWCSRERGHEGPCAARGAHEVPQFYSSKPGLPQSQVVEPVDGEL